MQNPKPQTYILAEMLLFGAICYFFGALCTMGVVFVCSHLL